MTAKLQSNLIDGLSTIATLLFWGLHIGLLLYTGRVLNTHSETISQVLVFSADEANQIGILRDVYITGSLEMGSSGFYHYGTAYVAITYILLKLLDVLSSGSVDVNTMGYALRSVSLAAFFGSSWVLLLILKKIGCSRIERSLIGIMFICSGGLVSLAIAIHPDTLCLFFILVAFYFSIIHQRTTLPHLCLAAFFLGLAFGTKYNAIFLVPYLFFVQVISTQRYQSHSSHFSKVNEIFIHGVFAAWCFVIGWLTLNPFLFSRFHQILEHIFFQQHNLMVATGGVTKHFTLTAWYDMLATEVGVLLSALIVAGAAVISCFYVISQLRRLFRIDGNWPRFLFLQSCSDCSETDGLAECVIEKQSDRRATLVDFSVYGQALCLCFTIAFLFMSTSIPYTEWRYMLHLYPMVFLLIGFVIISLRKKLLRGLIVLLISLSVIPNTAAGFKNAIYIVDEKYKNYFSGETSEILGVGKLLMSKYETDTRIFAGVYSYVETDYFKNVRRYYSLDDGFKEFMPDVVVMNKSAPGRYVWKSEGSRLEEKKFNVNAAHKNSALVNRNYEIFNDLSGWVVVLETDNTIVVERR